MSFLVNWSDGLWSSVDVAVGVEVPSFHLFERHKLYL